MSKWLASVKSLEEAKALNHVLPDILDMKNPNEGALGALPTSVVADVVKWVNGRCLTSATIGDLPMQAQSIGEAMLEMEKTGVDYIKVGLFAGPRLGKCVVDLEATISTLKSPVIGVMFADQPVNLSLIPTIKASGFAGVMVDTAKKNGMGLLDHWPETALHTFVQRMRAHDLMCGLAGALKISDIDALTTLEADYLGFRSALCAGHQREQALEPSLAAQIQQACHQFGLAS
jgi:uncharacterized protein (UPF0264 family)